VGISEKVDVIVSVMTGNFLVTEDLLPILFRARDTLLKPSGALLPDAAVMEAVPVSAAAAHDLHIAGWSTRQHGIDLSASRPYAANNIYYERTLLREATYLSDPQTLLALDLTTATYDALHAQVRFTVTTAGECHGFAGWFGMRLGDTWLSTSPKSPRTHWSAAYLPIDPPLTLEPGDEVMLTVDRAPEGDWNWRLASSRGSRRHSTLLGAPLTPVTIAKASKNYVPAMTDDAAAAAYVLAQVDGRLAVREIAVRLHESFPARYPVIEDALAFTQQVVNRY
jgi:hypothetical protein